MIKRRRELRKQAFSLIEVLLILALVGVLMGVVAGNASAFIKGSNYEPPGRVLKVATLDAVYFSSERKRKSFLSYDQEKVAFLVSDAEGSVLAEHPIYEKLEEDLFDDPELIPEVIFTAIGPEAGEAGGQTVYTDEQLLLKRITFHAGCSQPFEVAITFRGETEVIKFDPFSGYVLTPLE